MRYTVTLPHDYEWHPGTWAKENCASYLSSTAYMKEEQIDSTIEYHFAEEKDAMIFSLRWL
jgi:hypothetical protein